MTSEADLVIYPVVSDCFTVTSVNSALQETQYATKETVTPHSLTTTFF